MDFLSSLITGRGNTAVFNLKIKIVWIVVTISFHYDLTKIKTVLSYDSFDSLNTLNRLFDNHTL